MRASLRQRSALILLPFLLATAAVAWAQPEDEPAKPGGRQARVTVMPFVEGANVENAIRKLEQLRLQVRVVTIAGRTPGVVDRQEPKPNSALQPGAEVVLFVGIEPFVETIVPDVHGMSREDLIARLEEAYVLDIEMVDGDRRDAGRVVHQHPRAGRRLALRGVLEVRIVRPTQVVPRLVGGTEAEARARLATLGLLIEVEYVPQARVPADQVLSQHPQTGAEILPGGLVRVQVSGGGGAAPNPNLAAVPRLLGATLLEAQRLVHEAGLLPHPTFARVPGARAYTVVAQGEPVGALVALGEHVHFTVALPRTRAAIVRVPSLLGMSGSDATRILGEMGLRPVVRSRVSGLPAGTILEQSPGAGSSARVGSQVILSVAKRPPSGWSQQLIVPRVQGLDVLRARAVLLGSGLGVQVRRAEAPNEPVDKIAHQAPQAGTRVRPGTVITIVLPIASQMPDLIGKPRARAEQLMAGVGLQAIAEGPGFGIGRTQVVRQGAAPGTAVARGSRITFQYVFNGLGGRVRVPQLRLLSEARARQLLADVGLGIRVVGLRTPTSRVTAVNPVPGTIVNRGTLVQVAMGVVGPAVQLRVPSVVNRTLREARTILQAAGLRLRLEGAGNWNDQTIIRLQLPAAGQMATRGQEVELRAGPVQPPSQGTVPDVTGKSKRRAKEILRAAGFAVKVRGLDINVRGVKTKVKSQSPAGGAVAAPGTEVTITLGF